MLFQELVQLLAIFWLIIFAFSYHAKSRKSILSIQIAGLLLLALHFFLLSAWSGFAMIVVHIVMLVIFFWKEKVAVLNHKIFLYLFLFSYFVFTLITWQGYYSFFAFLGVGCATVAKWQYSPKQIRIISIPSGFFWIIYDVFVNSYGGLIAESIILISIIISLIMNKRSKLKKII